MTHRVHARWIFFPHGRLQTLSRTALASGLSQGDHRRLLCPRPEPHEIHLIQVGGKVPQPTVGLDPACKALHAGHVAALAKEPAGADNLGQPDVPLRPCLALHSAIIVSNSKRHRCDNAADNGLQPGA